MAKEWTTASVGRVFMELHLINMNLSTHCFLFYFMGCYPRLRDCGKKKNPHLPRFAMALTSTLHVTLCHWSKWLFARAGPGGDHWSEIGREIVPHCDTMWGSLPPPPCNWRQLPPQHDHHRDGTGQRALQGPPKRGWAVVPILQTCMSFFSLCLSLCCLLSFLSAKHTTKDSYNARQESDEFAAWEECLFNLGDVSSLKTLRRVKAASTGSENTKRLLRTFLMHLEDATHLKGNIPRILLANWSMRLDACDRRAWHVLQSRMPRCRGRE